MILSSGQNTEIKSNDLKIVLTDGNKLLNLTTDISIFLLDDAGKVSKDEDFIFFNNQDRSDVGIVCDIDSSETSVILSKIPNNISKVVFTLTISDGVIKKQNFKDISFVNFTINDSGKVNIATFNINTNKNIESALIIGEFYRRNGQWKFRAVGQGFHGGLQPLAELYGVDIGEGEHQDTNGNDQVLEFQSSAIDTSKKKSSTISLEKKGEKTTISLVKGATVTAKLQWKTNADLDLYCFYVDDSEKEDKVYYRKMGSLDSAPYIKLMGDSKSAGEEVVEISKPEKIKYALIAAYSAVSNGIGSFYSYKAKCTITDNNGQTVTTHLSHNDKYSYWVALAKISFHKNQLTIENVETYSSKENFLKNFELRTGESSGGFFSRSTKKVNGVNSYDAERSPYLFNDGSFMMSVGIREFK